MNRVAIFDNCSIRFNDSFALKNITWQISPLEHWVILGPNGAGKSALGAALLGQGEILSGSVEALPTSIQTVSIEKQVALLERERLKFISGEPESLVAEILAETCGDSTFPTELFTLFPIENLRRKTYRSLSTGESRKVLLLQALAARPEILVLDEPFDGLDSKAVKNLQIALKAISLNTSVILILNRQDEIPDFVNKALYIEAGKIVQENNIESGSDKQAFEHLLHLKLDKLVFPSGEATQNIPKLSSNDPLIRMKNVSISYDEAAIFEHLNWQVEAGSHWQITGPNGSGKTGLLNLVTGDHPQCYVNDIFVFGFQRGQGESIWEIKQYIGYVSTALQWEYRVSINIQNVLLSGFFDSIGLYQSPTEEQIVIAKQWLVLLGMEKQWDKSYSKLSYGEQRLLLIARAMVKQPALLILDEPCLGLDEINRSLVLQLISFLCGNGRTTVLYVNHHSEDSIAAIENILAL